MTFDDDFIRLNFDGGVKNVTAKSLGVDWPPPEEINVMGFQMKRIRYSQLTDEDRAGMTRVCRGAEYEVAK